MNTRASTGFSQLMQSSPGFLPSPDPSSWLSSMIRREEAHPSNKNLAPSLDSSISISYNILLISSGQRFFLNLLFSSYEVSFLNNSIFRRKNEKIKSLTMRIEVFQVSKSNNNY